MGKVRRRPGDDVFFFLFFFLFFFFFCFFFFLIFPRKKGFDSSCKESVCTKYQFLFSWKNEKNISKSYLLNFLLSMLSVNCMKWRKKKADVENRAIRTNEEDWHQTCRQGCSEKKVITNTSLYNFHPLKPHFYIVKLGFIGVYIILFWFICAQNVDCGYSLEPPCRGGSNEYP